MTEYTFYEKGSNLKDYQLALYPFDTKNAYYIYNKHKEIHLLAITESKLIGSQGLVYLNWS